MIRRPRLLHLEHALELLRQRARWSWLGTTPRVDFKRDGAVAPTRQLQSGSAWLGVVFLVPRNRSALHQGLKLLRKTMLRRRHS